MKSTLRCISACLAAGSLLAACGEDPGVPDTYTVAGTVSGLVGSGLVLTNDGVDLPIDASGSFALARTFSAGDMYAITVAAQPDEPAQVCTVTSGAGVVSANVEDVTVTCVTTPLTLASSTPTNGATNVTRAIAPTLTFSVPLNASTAAANVTFSRGDYVIAADVAAVDDTVTVTPEGPLSLLTTYTVSAEVGLQGTFGEALAAPTSVSFTTRDGAWRSPETVTLDTPNAQEPDVAIMADGSAVAVWSQQDSSLYNIWANVYTVGSGWGTAQLLETSSAGDATNPRIASDAQGRAFVVWAQSNGARVDIWGNRYTAGEGWSGAGQLSSSAVGTGNDAPAVGCSRNGEVMFAWVNTDGGDRSVWARRISAAGVLGDALRVETAVGNASYPRVVVGSDGAATAIWSNYDNIADTVDLWTNRYVSGVWGTAEIIEASDLSLSEYSIGIDGGDNVFAAWTQQNSDSSQGIYVRRRSDTGWEAVATVASTTDSSGYYPTVAADADGNALLVWGQYDTGTFHEYSSYFTASAGWGAPVLTDANSTADIAFDASGNALMVWQREVSPSIRRIFASRFTAAGGWTTPTLVTPGAAVYAEAPELAIDSLGNAMAVWVEYDIANNRTSIGGSRFDDSSL